MDDQLIINLGVHKTLANLFDICRMNYLVVVQKYVLISLFSYISLVLIADITHILLANKNQ
jgi:hypothetical protein